MAAFSSNGTPVLGSLDVTTFFDLPALPSVIFEWAAVIPLVCHLASYRGDYKTVGEVALLGRIHLGLFPRLGTFAGLSRLLAQGPGFLDEAGTRNATGSTVWDVSWGSVFPCANGAASNIIQRFFQRSRASQVFRMPERLPPEVTSKSDNVKAAQQETKPEPTPSPSKLCFRRYQSLHVLRFKRGYPKSEEGRRGTYCEAIRMSWAVFLPTVLLSLAVVVALCGAYGTAGLLLCGTVSTICSHLAKISRPPGFMESNETFTDTTMLIAPHPNAQEWCLYIGDRGIIDGILNKPMFVVPACKRNDVIAAWFKTAHVIQLLAMTYVTAQKGWDGVLLTLLVLLDHLARWRFRNKRLAKRWVSDSTVDADSFTFRFTSRMAMLGAIEMYRGCGRTVWMDTIAVPHPRRDAWLRLLNGETIDEKPLTAADLATVKFQSDLARISAKILEQKLNAEVI